MGGPRPRGWRLALVVVGVGIVVTNVTAVLINVATSGPLPPMLRWLDGNDVWWALGLLTLLGIAAALWGTAGGAAARSPTVDTVRARTQSERLVLDHATTDASGVVTRTRIFDRTVATRFLEVQNRAVDIELEEEEE